jgi:hypothetical protein
VKAGEEREKKEAASRARLEKGELGLDIYGMRRAPDDRGLKYRTGHKNRATVERTYDRRRIRKATPAQ